MSNKPVVYGKPHCKQCDATTRKLEGKEVAFEYVDISENLDALVTIKELGYLQAPVVYVDADTHWSGYRPDLISQYL